MKSLDKSDILWVVIATCIILAFGYILHQPSYPTSSIDQDKARAFAEKHKLYLGTVIYDYPDNPYVYWKGVKVYLEK